MFTYSIPDKLPMAVFGYVANEYNHNLLDNITDSRKLRIILNDFNGNPVSTLRICCIQIPLNKLCNTILSTQFGDPQQYFNFLKKINLSCDTNYRYLGHNVLPIDSSHSNKFVSSKQIEAISSITSSEPIYLQQASFNIFLLT